MSIDSDADLKGIRAAAEAVAITLRKMREFAHVGMSTQELDEYGNTLLKSFGAVSAPKKDYDFPGWTCISLNNEACHGIPSATRILKEGDLVNIDVSAELNGYYGDNGSSFILGEDRQGLQPLVDASRDILLAAVGKIKSKMLIADLGGFIEKEAKTRGFRVIRNLCGHGVGRQLHEAPFEIPNFRDRANKERFRKNTVIAVETFISTKATMVYEMNDGWTMKPKDGSFIAQHEHTLLVQEQGVEVLTIENNLQEC